MIEHVWSVLCSMTSVDQESNNFSLFNTLETLTLFAPLDKQVEIIIPYEIVSFWTRSSEDQPCSGKMRITFIYPSGNKGTSIELPINLIDGVNYRTRVKVEKMKIPEGAGRYFFGVEFSEGEKTWKTATKLPLVVKFDPSRKEKEKH